MRSFAQENKTQPVILATKKLELYERSYKNLLQTDFDIINFPRL